MFQWWIVGLSSSAFHIVPVHYGHFVSSNIANLLTHFEMPAMSPNLANIWCSLIRSSASIDAVSGTENSSIRWDTSRRCAKLQCSKRYERITQVGFGRSEGDRRKLQRRAFAPSRIRSSSISRLAYCSLGVSILAWVSPSE